MLRVRPPVVVGVVQRHVVVDLHDDERPERRRLGQAEDVDEEPGARVLVVHVHDGVVQPNAHRSTARLGSVAGGTASSERVVSAWPPPQHGSFSSACARSPMDPAPQRRGGGLLGNSCGVSRQRSQTGRDSEWSLRNDSPAVRVLLDVVVHAEVGQRFLHQGSRALQRRSVAPQLSTAAARSAKIGGCRSAASGRRRTPGHVTVLHGLDPAPDEGLDAFLVLRHRHLPRAAGAVGRSPGSCAGRQSPRARGNRRRSAGQQRANSRLRTPNGR